MLFREKTGDRQVNKMNKNFSDNSEYSNKQSQIFTKQVVFFKVASAYLKFFSFVCETLKVETLLNVVPYC